MSLKRQTDLFVYFGHNEVIKLREICIVNRNETQMQMRNLHERVEFPPFLLPKILLIYESAEENHEFIAGGKRKNSVK